MLSLAYMPDQFFAASITMRASVMASEMMDCTRGLLFLNLSGFDPCQFHRSDQPVTMVAGARR
jgi:hypothetical protein